MPNWCEGNIRLRGKRNAIVEFLKNELKSTGYERLADGPITGMVEINDEYGEVSVRIPEEKKNLAFAAFYIKDTRRNFIDGNCFEVCMDDKDVDEVHTVCIDGFKAAWGIEPTPYIAKAKKYGIDIRIVGFERGMKFEQEIEIVDGEIVKNEEIEYDDWYWECPMPNMGG